MSRTFTAKLTGFRFQINDPDFIRRCSTVFEEHSGPIKCMVSDHLMPSKPEYIGVCLAHGEEL